MRRRAKWMTDADWNELQELIADGAITPSHGISFRDVVLVAAAVAAGFFLFSRHAHTTEIVTKCDSGLYGTTCKTVIDGPRPYGANVIRVEPFDRPMVFNTDPNWGRNCRSCTDASKDK